MDIHKIFYIYKSTLWDWQTNTVVEFADQAVIWLIKWNVWQQTGKWLGKETPHDEVALYFSIGVSDQCWCGSGVEYGKCHQLQDKLVVDGELSRFLKTKLKRKIFSSVLLLSKIEFVINTLFC